MLRRTRTVLAACVVVTAGATPAMADNGWGNVNCSQHPQPGCELGAGSGGNGGQSGGSGSGGAGSSTGGGAPVCSYAQMSPESEAANVAGGFLPPLQTGHHYYLKACEGSNPEWVALGGVAPPPPSPEELARAARARLRLPAPRIHANPAGDQLVNLPTWLWLERGTWRDVSATAAVPGVSVIAIARPASVSWAMGDGNSVTCAGPGTPFPPGADPKSASPDCGYVYRISSAGQRSEAFAVTATISWTITWSGAGQSGVFPNMTTTGSIAVRVAESQAIATG
ncbi:hypothetical protein [Kibdelosporangium philippinense]|uniref:hypothetical protein n=1 Tax=Kibdelosporangium philippinense TaxID=211113 RepID=UPI003619C1E1